MCRRLDSFLIRLVAGCVFQARHGMERPGFFLPDAGNSVSPVEYDYYGAYDDDGAWRYD